MEMYVLSCPFCTNAVHILYTLSCAYITSQVPLPVSTESIPMTAVQSLWWTMQCPVPGTLALFQSWAVRAHSAGTYKLMGREGLAVGSVHGSTHTFGILMKIAKFASREEHLPALHSDVRVPAAPAWLAAVPLFLCHSES